MSSSLSLASHAEPSAYWSGGEYELNLSYGTLRDQQWQRLIRALWGHATLSGPFANRVVPGEEGKPIPVRVPAPTAAQTHYGQLDVEGLPAGCRVMATRSLFECVSLQVPLGMFEGIRAGQEKKGRTSSLRIGPLDHVYRDIALALFEIVPFDIANIGYQCECRLVDELRADTSLRLELMAMGNFFARDAALRSLGIAPDNYPQVRSDLRWIPA